MNQWPADLKSKTDTLLGELGYSFKKPEQLARAIKQLSDFYIANPSGTTPWTEKWAQAAYLAYFLPLNFARVRRAVDKAAQAGFFEGLETMVDFGSGLGSAQLAIAQEKSDWKQVICHDQSSIPMRLHEKLLSSTEGMQWQTNFAPGTLPDANSRLAVLSYVFTELAELPKWARESDALLIIEPSTREDGRRLQALRGDLIQSGFQAFAPCTHQKACPLLVDSERDWCHDRLEWTGDSEWESLEQHLPMKNRTLTFSYLAVRKSKSPTLPNGQLGRIVGDALEEKGKTRQLVCRDEKREFLAWFPDRIRRAHGKEAAEKVFARGDLIRLPQDLELKANEIRIKDLSSIETIAFPKTQL